MSPAAFKPDRLPVLIGSLPMEDHQAATDLVLQYTPEIPLWAQLPKFAQEGMTPQFLPGLPGLVGHGDKTHVDTASTAYDEGLVRFYEAYLAVAENSLSLEDAGFVLTRDTANGFFVLLEKLASAPSPPLAVKGQTTGPFTFTTGLVDQEKRALFYNEQARDVAVKLLAMKAAWQTAQLATLGVPVIVFIDEPALAGFGSSEFISISREEVAACLQEVIEAIHGQGGLAGIHVCANTDWSMILETSVDIVNFDAYAYFDRFCLFPELIQKHIAAGGLLAWGIVPTLKPEEIEAATADGLADLWRQQTAQLIEAGIDRDRLMQQSLITPACGTGSITLELARKVLTLTRDTSRLLRA
jgi:hypothetical protein